MVGRLELTLRSLVLVAMVVRHTMELPEEQAARREEEAVVPERMGLAEGAAAERELPLGTVVKVAVESDIL
jgi:hypothetical protein